MKVDIESLTIDDDGWLIDVHGERIAEPCPVPVYGHWPREQQQSDTEAVVRFIRRIKRSGIDMGDEMVTYDFITAPGGERFYTCRVGLPVNELPPMSITEQVFATT